MTHSQTTNGLKKKLSGNKKKYLEINRSEKRYLNLNDIAKCL